ncbi:hypothetical protein [uncultured Methanobacterium sp.]|uniref:hypothetical protein n=1 Tax=uncultured Methanobacterium sp. TaxID=176306 RepID=UPI002AA76FBF|nr:hypothetical protein [uncultured Methanobacterium sp.]
MLTIILQGESIGNYTVYMGIGKSNITAGTILKQLTAYINTTFQQKQVTISTKPKLP